MLQYCSSNVYDVFPVAIVTVAVLMSHNIFTFRRLKVNNQISLSSFFSFFSSLLVIDGGYALLA